MIQNLKYMINFLSLLHEKIHSFLDCITIVRRHSMNNPLIVLLKVKVNYLTSIKII